MYLDLKFSLWESVGILNKHKTPKSASGMLQKHFFVEQIIKKFKSLRFILEYDTEGESC